MNAEIAERDRRIIGNLGLAAGGAISLFFLALVGVFWLESWLADERSCRVEKPAFTQVAAAELAVAVNAADLNLSLLHLIPQARRTDR